MGKGYSRSGGEARGPKSSGAAGLVDDKLEETARQGAQRMLAEALEMEVDEFLRRARHARGPEFRGFGVKCIPLRRSCGGAGHRHRHGPDADGVHPPDAAGQRGAHRGSDEGV